MEALTTPVIRGTSGRQPAVSVPSRNQEPVDDRSPPASSTAHAELARPRASLPPFDPPGGAIFARVQALCRWVDVGLAPTSVYLADEHGLIVHGVRSNVEYGAVMAPLLAAMRQMEQALGARPTRGSLRVRAMESLSWVECSTSLGDYCLGILAPEPIHDEALARVQSELGRTLEGDT